MAQVVTSENLVEFVTTGKVADFKAPGTEASPSDATKGPEPKTAEASAAALDKTKTNGSESASQARGADGKFQPAEKADATSAEVERDVADLSERARKQVGKYFRQRKEAEEFATTEGRRALAAESRAAQAEAELALLRGGTKSNGPGSTEPEEAEPKKEDFTTLGDYARALTKYEVKKAAREAGTASAQANAAAAQEQQAQEEAQRLGKAFADRQATFQESTPDYEQVLEDCDADMPNATMQYLVESEVGPQLAYFLSKPENQHHITRLNKLSPTRQIAELGKLEDKLAASAPAATGTPAPKPAGTPAAAAAARQVSNAPAPIAPLQSDSGATQTHADPSQMSFAELREYRRQEALKGKRS